ncbi:hypothetical protein GMMP15_1410019 [Candidatus Magnetomoraceae bacterium gMMP-15]
MYNDQPGDNDSLRILIAEDNPNNRMIISLFLEDTSYSVDMVENGRQALEKFESCMYDIIFMDIQMPVMDGLEAIKKIRQYEIQKARSSQDEKAIPIIAMTADTTKKMQQECFEKGFTDFLGKPIFDQDHLLQSIVKHTENR